MMWNHLVAQVMHMSVILGRDPSDFTPRNPVVKSRKNQPVSLALLHVIAGTGERYRSADIRSFPSTNETLPPPFSCEDICRKDPIFHGSALNPRGDSGGA